jgi:hypothetical protein
MGMKKMSLPDVFKVQQANGYAFRAEFIRSNSNLSIWIAESSEEVYVFNILSVLRMDTYLGKVGDYEKVIMLYKNDEEELETVEIGSFTHEDALNFIRWVHGSLHRSPALAA